MIQYLLPKKDVKKRCKKELQAATITTSRVDSNKSTVLQTTVGSDTADRLKGWIMNGIMIEVDNNIS